MPPPAPVQSGIYIRGFNILGFSQPQAENTWLKKIPEGSNMQNLNLQHAVNNLHSIYTVLGIISNLEMVSSVHR